MKYRKLRDLEVSAIGMGCVNLSFGTGIAATSNDALTNVRFDI